MKSLAERRPRPVALDTQGSSRRSSAVSVESPRPSGSAKEPTSAKSSSIAYSPLVNAVQNVVGRVGSILSTSSLRRDSSVKSPLSVKHGLEKDTFDRSGGGGGGGDADENSDDEVKGRTSLVNSKLRRRFSSSAKGTGLLMLLENERKLKVFSIWLKSTHAGESLELWDALNELHVENDVQVRIASARVIVEKFLLPTSTRQVNLKSATLKIVQDAYQDESSKAFADVDFFNDVQCEIFYDMMQSDAYTKFKLARLSDDSSVPTSQQGKE